MTKRLRISTPAYVKHHEPMPWRSSDGTVVRVEREPDVRVHLEARGQRADGSVCSLSCVLTPEDAKRYPVGTVVRVTLESWGAGSEQVSGKLYDRTEVEVA